MSGLWYNPSAPEFEKKRSKSIIHSFDVKGYRGLTINPYQGCQHRCAYCYATYEWSPEFYDKVYVKANAPELLEKELASWKGDMIDPVMVCSATDAYQPAEIRFGLTRKCVQILQKYGVPYYVFTKSAIIERDLALHANYRHCCVIWSITTCNERVRRVVEPGTPPAARIFQVIRKFADAGATCAVNVDPIMPLVTDTEQELQAIVAGCKQAGVRHAFGAMLRMRTDIWERMKVALRLLGIPGGIERYQQLYGFQEPLSASYVSCDRAFAKGVIGRLEEKLCAAEIDTDFPTHMKARRIDKSCLGQRTLLSYT
jgi:DNA repair photolyase